MYKKEDVCNVRNTTYELTEMDRRIYEEAGWVLYQVNKHSIEYVRSFGTVYGQTVVCVHQDGTVEAERYFLSKEEECDYEDVEVPEEMKELAKLKYEEMMRLHPNGENWVEYNL